MLIPKEALEVHKIASKDENREALRFVHAARDDYGKPRLFATDGVRAIMATWVEPAVEIEPNDFGDLTERNGFEARIPPTMCADVARAVPNAAHDPVCSNAWLQEGGACIRMGAGDSKTTGQAVQYEAPHRDYDTPDILSLLRQSMPNHLRVCLNAKMLAELVTVLSKVAGTSGVVFQFTDNPLAPVKIYAQRSDESAHAEALIMPMRSDLTGTTEDQEQTLEDEARREFGGAPKSPADGECVACGCTESNACPEGCSWDPKALAEDPPRYLCSACVEHDDDTQQEEAGRA